MPLNACTAEERAFGDDISRSTQGPKACNEQTTTIGNFAVQAESAVPQATIDTRNTLLCCDRKRSVRANSRWLENEPKKRWDRQEREEGRHRQAPDHDGTQTAVEL